MAPLQVQTNPFVGKMIALRPHQQAFNYKNKNANKISEIDSDFLYQLRAIVKDNLHNELFTVEDLAKQLFMSRSNLFRKMKTLLNKKPNVYIRNTRLEYAMRLLKKRDKQVSSISLEVGFNDVKYFSRRFKLRFGITPNQVLLNQNIGNIVRLLPSH